MQDRLEKERADSKNSVEEYVYEMRSKIYDIYQNFISDADKGKFQKVLDDAENWLYEDGEDEKKKAYVDKLASLKVFVAIDHYITSPTCLLMHIYSWFISFFTETRRSCGEQI